MRIHRFVAAAAPAAALLLAACPGRGREEVQAEPPRAEFSVLPPRVESSSVRLLERERDGNNAVLTVRFAADPRLGRTVSITPESTVVVLHDDGTEPDSTAGDRSFSGFVRVSPDELAVFQRHTVQLAARSPTVPVFSGRVRVGETSPARLGLVDTTRLTPGKGIALGFIGFPVGVQETHSLMVRDPAVLTDPTRTFNPCTGVGNPNGKWTFNYLMTQMVGGSGVPPTAFVKAWLSRWLVPQTVNGWSVPARPNVQQIINAWPKLPNGELNLQRAPFRLIAIVNRVDLRGNSVYGGGNAGEGRFVFELMNAQCQPQRFTAILEYGVPLSGCPVVRAYGKAWYDLGGLVLGSPAYNTSLEKITDRFTAANAAPRKPNGSALNQLRTNEIVLSFPWELREFTIANASHLLEQATVKQTPELNSNNNTKRLADFINPNAAAILNNSYTVPLLFQGTHFLGGAAPIPTSALFWDAAPPHPSVQITTANTRFGFSLNTCSGCHAGETATTFQHLSTFIPGGISRFLTGETVADPAGEKTGGLPTQRAFDDLARRAADLDALVNTPCIAQLAFNPLRMVH
jgi:hypothetical protein